MKRSAILVSSIALLSNCDRPASANERGAVRGVTPAAFIDSAMPAGEALRRFRAGLDSPAHLDGPAKRDELVNRYLAAARAKDRAALQRLAIDRAEFGFLVFPQSRWSKPPYNQPPELEWLLLSQQSDASLSKLLRRAERMEFRGYACAKAPEQDGGLHYWPDCVVHVREGGRVRDVRLFGSIIELDGRFKFRDLKNDL